MCHFSTSRAQRQAVHTTFSNDLARASLSLPVRQSFIFSAFGVKRILVGHRCRDFKGLLLLTVCVNASSDSLRLPGCVKGYIADMIMDTLS